MILKGRSAKKFRWFDIPLVLLPALLLLCFFLFGAGNSNGSANRIKESVVVWSSDLETVKDGRFIEGDNRFAGGDHQSNLQAHSGKFSVKVDNSNVYALEHWYKPQESRRLQVSVWRNSPDGVKGVLVAAARNSDEFYESTQTASKSDGDWDLLTLNLNVPRSVNEIKIYCFIEPEGEKSVFFDDLELREVPAVRDYDKVALSEVLIETSPTGMLKLETKRDKAWEKGILESDRSDWVDARFIYDEQPYEAEIRLKGDWLDHLEGDKWSFRVKLEDGAIDGKQVFSVQSPHTRSFLHEWVFHELLNQEDILTPSYEFVKLKMNGKILGTYAMEEHFMKSLVEHRNRREGPILKFTEDDFWESIKRVKALQKEDKYFFDATTGERAFWSSKTESFEEENALENERLGMQTERAYAMLAAYKYNTVELNKIIDAERMGKYLAIVDLTEAYHGLAWHNQRWYYNPVADKLEPIGFDGFTEKLPTNSLLLSEQAYKRGNYDPYWQFFRDPEIMKHYCQFIWQLAFSDYIDQFQDKSHGEIRAIEEALESEYSTSVYDENRLLRRARKLQVALPPRTKSLGVFAAGPDTYSVTNSHILPLQITGYRAEGNLIQNLSDPIFISPTTYDNKAHLINLPSNIKQVYYTLAGGGESLEAIVSPLRIIIPERHGTSLDAVNGAGYTVIDKEIIAKSGQLSKALIVPPDYRLIFPPGTQINLTNDAFLLSYSPIDILGTEEQPVVIHSSDGTGAFAVMEAAEESNVSYAQFRKLGTIEDAGYVLTGGVTFYQSPVKIRNTSFEDSQQEDAFNAVNTTFTLDECKFIKTAFDALDSDFCHGEISNCVFIDAGNDALDFSGSSARINNVTMLRIGDKGISAGEHSKIYADQIEITDSKIGAVSKDLSELKIEFIKLTNVREAFAAYRKKIDFGPGTLIVNRYEAEGIRHLKMLEEGSTIELSTGGE